MARRKKSIEQIRAQVGRALGSLNERYAESGTNKYMFSQVTGYNRNNRNNGLTGDARMRQAVDYAGQKYNQRGQQIIDAGQRLVQRMQKGAAAKAARKAQGLAAG